ncbi:MAG: hypothetical protein AAF485_14645, partial [Chloroflexota bacterium]
SLIGGGYMSVASTVSDTACPHIQDPRPVRDMLKWRNVFEPTYKSFDAETVYGVNIWQVKEQNLISSIQNMVAQGGPGLVISGGQIHAVDIYREAESNFFTVVFVYEWGANLANAGDSGAPISLMFVLIRFYQMVEAYNWTMVEELESDISVYAGMIDHKFHETLCDYPSNQ